MKDQIVFNGANLAHVLEAAAPQKGGDGKIKIGALLAFLAPFALQGLGIAADKIPVPVLRALVKDLALRELQTVLEYLTDDNPENAAQLAAYWKSERVRIIRTILKISDAALAELEKGTPEEREAAADIRAGK